MKVTIQYAYTQRNAPGLDNATQETTKVGAYVVHLPETTNQLAPVAMTTRLPSSDGSDAHEVAYKWANNKLWTSVRTFVPSVFINAKDRDDNYKITPYLCAYWDHKYPHNENSQIFRSGLYIQNGLSEFEVHQQINTWAAQCLIIDGVLHRVASEPRYVIQPYGVEHKDVSMYLVATDWYNALVPADWYFSALHLDHAIAKIQALALARGSTASVRLVPNRIIDVFIPEAIRVDPAIQHAEGDPIVNDMHKVFSRSTVC